MKINDYINKIDDELHICKKVLELYNNVFVFKREEDIDSYEYGINEICNNIIGDDFNKYNKNIVFFSNKKINNESLKFNHHIDEIHSDTLYSYEEIDNYIVFSDFMYISCVINKSNYILNISNIEIPCHYTNTFRDYINKTYEWAIKHNYKIIFENLKNQEYWENYIKTLEVFQ